MSIAQNPIIKAWTKVFAWWYTITLLWWLMSTDLPADVMGYAFSRALAQTLVVLLLGALGGAGVLMLLRLTGQVAQEGQLHAGTEVRGAKVLLGAAPSFGEFPALSGNASKSARSVLSSTRWWSAMQTQSPPHAEAMIAVVAMMLRLPRLPASPYPGGHGGRTLIEHSLAVADVMMREAGAWAYRGQFDKRGALKVPLNNPDVPHRFSREDAPLLLLAAVAHDIGKMACYEPLPGEQQSADGPYLVKEVVPNHDHEGARLLRRIPEVMALPLDDRQALLLACGYYHHPFSIPLSSWVTDTMRSLTELLAHVDIATGRSEGHVLMPGATDDEDYDSDVPTGAAVSGLAMQRAGMAGGANADNSGAEESAESAVAAVALPRELGLLRSLLRKPGAIGGNHRSIRCAVRRGNTLYVLEAVMRLRAKAEASQIDALWASEAFEPANGNMAPFTRALARQLADLGWLTTNLDGRDYSPARALFKSTLSVDGKAVPVLVVSTDAIPGSLSAPEHEHDVSLHGSLWGGNQAKNKTENAAGSDEGAHDDAPSTSVWDDDAVAEPGATHSADVQTATALSIDSDDMPFSMPSIAAAVPAPSQPESVEPTSSDVTHESTGFSDAALATLAAFRLTILDSSMDLSEISNPDVPGASYVAIEKDSQSGEVLRGLMLDVQSAGADARAIHDALVIAPINQGAGPLCYILRMSP